MPHPSQIRDVACPGLRWPRWQVRELGEKDLRLATIEAEVDEAARRATRPAVGARRREQPAQVVARDGVSTSAAERIPERKERRAPGIEPFERPKARRFDRAGEQADGLVAATRTQFCF